MAYSIWYRLFPKANNFRSLDALPEEIIVDHILARLTVKEILKVRKINKALCAITKKASVWKRFLPHLRSLQQPLAPLPPTWKYNAREITPLELERLVTRAISLDNNWRGSDPKIYRELHCSAFDNVLDMVLLPGGHYLVTSVQDRLNKFSIVIWAMDHPATGRPCPIIFRQTMVRAYHLQAKYMTVDGRKSLCVAFLRKRHKDTKDKREIPITVEMGSKDDDEDESMPIKYECTTISMSLASLGQLTNRECPPGTRHFENIACTIEKEDPVTVVSRIRTGRQLGAVSLDEIDGAACVCVVKRPNRIVLERLGADFHNNPRMSLTCRISQEYKNQQHSIWNFRVIPSQCQILILRVVRAVKSQDPDTYLVELFDIPTEFGDFSIPPESARFLQSTDKLLNVQIAELRGGTQNDESIMPSIAANKPPPPISLYLRYDTGVDHVSIWPCARPLPPSPPPSPGSVCKERPPMEYYYSLNDVESRTLESKHHDMGCIRTVPGAYRALVYTVPPDLITSPTPTTGLSTYVYRGDEKIYLDPDAALELIPDYFEVHADGMTVDEWTARENGDILMEEEEQRKFIWPQPRQNIHSKRQLLANVPLQDAFDEVLRKGVTAITWDEDTGRVCITTDFEKELHILDFSCARKPDADDQIIFDELQKMAVDESQRLRLIRNPVETCFPKSPKVQRFARPTKKFRKLPTYIFDEF
ncbi:hypothetical protein SCHPADRAFT_934748 [Schizopora paradoxa]|uniref:F-box domain-containing protein n=1 Tax=Schizopora paradoxa TaxID=27342 RepID=A0A0H2SEI2_9AGAM|nr:hypothetical protein SCHPADRAFT_934748 [Schizopora paradoxa]